MTPSDDKIVRQPDTKPVQKTQPSGMLTTVNTFETVMNQAGKFLAHPIVLIVGLIATIFLVTRTKNQNSNDLVAENAELKDQIRTLQSDLTEMKRKVKKLKAREEEFGYENDSRGYSIEHKKAPLQLLPAERKKRTLYLQ